MSSNQLRNRQTVRNNEAADQEQENETNLRYGPMPTFPNQKRFTRHIIVIAMIVVVYFYSNKEKERVFASAGTSVSQRTASFKCSEMFAREVGKFKGCVPKSCGRGVYDNIVTSSEVNAILELAEKGFQLSRPAGGAAILDLHSGALSHKTEFINIYKLHNVSSFLTPEVLAVYRAIRTKIQHVIASQFLVEPTRLHLAHPTFFSRLTWRPAQTPHDEYWHHHIDKETYPSFHYTALLYLSTYGADFEGGRFVFVEADNSTYVVEPVKSRVLIFTSGAENPHRVEKVKSGARIALTIAFTCNEALAVKDPTLQANKPPTVETDV